MKQQIRADMNVRSFRRLLRFRFRPLYLKSVLFRKEAKRFQFPSTALSRTETKKQRDRIECPFYLLPEGEKTNEAIAFGGRGISVPGIVSGPSATFGYHRTYCWAYLLSGLYSGDYRSAGYVEDRPVVGVFAGQVFCLVALSAEAIAPPGWPDLHPKPLY